MRRLATAAAVLCLGALLGGTGQAATVSDPRCEYLVDPLGIDVVKPRLSWIIKAERRGEAQTAYQVLVASTPELLAKDTGDLWDSGQVKSDQSIHLEYAGKPLQSRMACHWKVRVWNKDGQASVWSEPALWTMGLLAAEDWKAQWIWWQPTAPASVPKPEGAVSPWFRKTFDLDEKPDRAMVYLNIAGYGELYVNGQKVGADILGPAVSNYPSRSFYLTYDIAPLLQKGRNCIGVWLGRGWYVEPRPATTPGPRACVQCDIVAGGRTIEVLSDESWKAAASPYATMAKWVWNDFGGERYDANLENPDWCKASCDDQNWAKAVIVPPPSPRTETQSCPRNRKNTTIAPVACTELSPGRYELDFGTNLTGWLDIRLPGLKVGDRVTIDYADRRAADDVASAPEAKLGRQKPGTYQTFNQRDEFVSAGREGERFCSKFNYHGFRYAIVQGLPAKPDLKDAQALLIDTSLESRGEFECSNDLFNRIHKLHVWTIRSLNLGGYMVDCPHRERLGYGGDGQISAESCIMNFGMPAFYGKWLADWRLRQDPSTGDLPHVAPQSSGGGGPGWGGALAALTWRTYLHYGDRRILEENYDAMRRYVDFLEVRSKDNILRGYGGKWDFLGDWVAPGRGMDTRNWPPQRAAEFFNNCYRVYLWELQEKAAVTLGREDEVAHCRSRLDAIRPAIHNAFHDPKQNHYVLDEQAYQAMPLYTQITPEAERAAVLKKLEDGIRVRCNGHLDTGMFGTYFLIQYLQATGRNDLMYTIANQRTYPSWGYMLDQGATTLWEQWNGHWSRIHACFVSLDGWFYQGLAGIQADPTVSGYKKIVIKPAIVGDLTWVKAHHDSPHGRIISHWKRQGEGLALDVTIPANTTATVYVPAKDTQAVTESGQPAARAPGVKFLSTEGGAAIFAVGSGAYRFESTLP